MNRDFFPYRTAARALDVRIEDFPNKVTLDGKERVTFYMQGTARLDNTRPKVMSAAKALKVAVGELKFEDV
jgi:hypothetical protein